MQQGLPVQRDLVADIVEWDVRNWGRAVGFWDEEARRVAGALPSFTVLELGARGGGVSLYWALLGGMVLCTDVTGDFGQARALHAKYGVADRVRYETLDAAAIPFPHEGAFDVVTFKSVLGNVGHHGNVDALVAMAENAYRALKPGGMVFFCENMVASPVHMAARRLFTDRVGAWHYVTIPEVFYLMRRFELVDYTTLGVLGVFGRNGAASAVFGAADERIERFVRPSHRYIISAMFRKSASGHS